MTLRDSEYRARATFDFATELAGSARGRDEKGYRTEFIEIVRRARELAVRDQSARIAPCRFSCFWQ